MLKLSNDRKVSPLSRWATGAKRYEPMVPNSFGLPAGPDASCPGATEFCTGCYAVNIERAFPSVARLTAHNFELLKACGSNVSAMAALLSEAVGRFDAQRLKVEKRTGKPVPAVFRIHWDGDFYSAQYAAAWAQVIREFGHVQFWCYTRSFFAVGMLANLDNLSLYLSVDEFNAAEGQATHEAFPWTRLALCAQDFDSAEVLARKVSGRNAPKCPEQTGRYALVNAETGQGACVECGLCVKGVNNVRFSVDH